MPSAFLGSSFRFCSAIFSVGSSLPSSLDFCRLSVNRLPLANQDLAYFKVENAARSLGPFRRMVRYPLKQDFFVRFLSECKKIFVQDFELDHFLDELDKIFQ